MRSKGTKSTELSDDCLVSFVIATYNRKDDLQEALDSILSQKHRPIEIIVISNSDDGTSNLFRNGGSFDQEQIRYYHFEEQMGCPGARNIGYEKAEGDVVITIDDDAVLQDPEATDKVIDLFRQDSDLGIIGFRGVNLDGKTPYHWVPSREEGMAHTAFEATHFIGFGNAIRADVFEEVGMYPSEFVYSFEEKDLSLRTINHGYHIRYEPSIEVLHKVSSQGRLSDNEVSKKGLTNRIRVAIRNLPWRYVVATTVFWTVQQIRSSGLQSEPLEALSEVFQARSDLLAERTVISRNAIHYIKSQSGPLYFWIFI